MASQGKEEARQARVGVVIPGAGHGERLGSLTPKAFLPLGGVPLLIHAVRPFQENPEVEEIVVVVASGHREEAEELCRRFRLDKVKAVVTGGPRRQDSVRYGLEALTAEEIVVVHDAARPLLSTGLVTRVIEAARRTGAATAAIPVYETVKQVHPSGVVERTLDRERLWLAQTPQAFQVPLLREAHRRAQEEGIEATDDAALVERLGHPVEVVLGERQNIKVTAPEDLPFLEQLFRSEAWGMRVGIGFDIHRLVPGRRLVLGGVEIPSSRGLEGVSDADVLLHAIMDALLGAAGEGDIGRHFPPGDPASRDAPSLSLLARVAELLANKGLRVGHIDAVAILEAPRIGPYVKEMQEAVAGTLRIPPWRVNIKATTPEGLGALGREEGIAAYAVCTLIESKGSA